MERIKPLYEAVNVWYTIALGSAVDEPYGIPDIIYHQGKALWGYKTPDEVRYTFCPCE